MRQDFKCSRCGSRECGLLCERGTNEPICANCVFDERDKLRSANAKLVAACKDTLEKCRFSDLIDLGLDVVLADAIALATEPEKSPPRA